MNREFRQPVAILVAVWAVLALSGCSVAGFVIGSFQDASESEKDIFVPSQPDNIERGRTIDVLRTDGRIVSGVYAELDRGPDTTYAATYAEAMSISRLGKLLPALGDTLLIVLRVAEGRREMSGRLIGFSEAALRVHSMVHKQPADVLLRYIDTVYAPHGSRIDGEILRRQIANGEIPLFQPRLLVSSEHDTTSVPIDSILKVSYPTSHYAKWYLFAAGAAIDGIIISIMVAFSNIDF